MFVRSIVGVCLGLVVAVAYRKIYIAIGGVPLLSNRELILGSPLLLAYAIALVLRFAKRGVR